MAWCTEFVVTRAHLAAFETVLEPLSSALSIALESDAEECCRLRAHAADEVALAAIGQTIAETAEGLGVAPLAVQIETIAEVDWAARTARDFPPIEVGRYFVHGGHIAAPPDRCVALRIEAGAAFGTGEHESTRGCLLALDGLARRRLIRRASRRVATPWRRAFASATATASMRCKFARRRRSI
jgi:ribosomal protein L11 methyltransferase